MWPPNYPLVALYAQPARISRVLTNVVRKQRITMSGCYTTRMGISALALPSYLIATLHGQLVSNLIIFGNPHSQLNPLFVALLLISSQLVNFSFLYLSTLSLNTYSIQYKHYTSYHQLIAGRQNHYPSTLNILTHKPKGWESTSTYH